MLKCSYSKHLGRGRLPITTITREFRAFTLAEVLITLGIIGVVAAITMPTIINNIKSKQFETANKKTQATIIQALMRMKAGDSLAGFSSTENFIKEFSKYMKVLHVCPFNDLSKCFPAKFTSGDTEIELSQLSGAKSLGHNDWGTNINGIMTANGTAMILAYNPNCDSENNYKGCAGIAYDLNSIYKLNKFTANGENDLGTYNATFVASSNCGEVVCSNIHNGCWIEAPAGGIPDSCVEENRQRVLDKCEELNEYIGGICSCSDSGCFIAM